MSFEEQERALFDLLFDENLRMHFCEDPLASLAGYELDADEGRDFLAIRPDALKLDAEMRVNLVLSQLCRGFPLTISIVSSLDKGMVPVKGLVDTQTMLTGQVDRVATFGNRLREVLATCRFASAMEQNIATAILEVESGMAWTAAALKRVVLDGGAPPETQSGPVSEWAKYPIHLAAHVSAAIIPQPYLKLKRALCPCADSELWRHLGRQPVSASQRRKILAHEDPRLLVTRAYLNHLSHCEPETGHKTVELSEGFAPLFQHVNGTNSVNDILAQLKQAGAAGQILQSVERGFQQLLQNGMLEIR